MRRTLTLHPDSRCLAATRIDVGIARLRRATLALHYVVIGRIGDLSLPAATAPTRADELWQHTCFEAFLCATAGAAYYEFNFAPSRQWAAYRFGAYRDEMIVVHQVSAPRFSLQSSGEAYELHAALELDGMPGLPSEAAWRLGLSAVIEETNGNKSYWALAHPPGKPDFHHALCFAHELPAPA
jgi:hypothetical protein